MEEGFINNLVKEKQLINKLVIGTEVEKQLVHTLFIKWYRLLFFETHQRKCLNLGAGGLACFHNGHHIHRKNNFNRFNNNLFSLKRLLHRYFLVLQQQINCHSQYNHKHALASYMSTVFENDQKRSLNFSWSF